MFMGPLEATKPWQTNGLSGVYRFLKRVWRFVVTEDDGTLSSNVSDQEDSLEVTKMLHKTIKKVGEDIEALRFNTAISAMMEFVNLIYRDNRLSKKACKDVVLLLSPFAPHLAEELWQRLGETKSLAYHPWPSYDPELVKEDVVTISIQVNGKLRGTLSISKTASKEETLATAKAVESVAKYLDGVTIKKEIFVPGKIVNFVV